MEFVPRFVAKTDNEIGLQLADLVAQPIAMHTLNPSQPNRAYEAIKNKLVPPGAVVFPED